MATQGEGSHLVTNDLADWVKEGDPEALEKVLQLLYEELREIAHRHMAHERPGHTLQATAVLNEALLKLGSREEEFASKAHFKAWISRRIAFCLVDYARSRRADKRGGGVDPETLIETLSGEAEEVSPDILIDVAAALDELRNSHPQGGVLADMVELRFFGGMQWLDIWPVLNISETTLHRNWKIAKAWLKRWFERGTYEATK